MDNVIDIFKKQKETVIQEIKTGNTLEEDTEFFFNRLDIVMNEFQSLSVGQKYEILESLIMYGKSMTALYMDIKKQREFDIKWYADLADELEVLRINIESGEKGIE